MWLRKTVATMLGAAALLVGVTATVEAEAAHDVNLGTLAPGNSPWGTVFKAWKNAVAQKSGNELNLNWYFNGTQGDEAAMIDKMKGSQLDGAAVTSVGLSKIDRDVLALQMPGLFTDWETLDRVRAEMLPKFLVGISAQGFQLVGIGDVGLARTFSNKPIRVPSDLSDRKVYRWKDDDGAAIAADVMGYTSVPESVVTLKSALSAGRVDTLTVPALPLVALQWHTHVTHATSNVSGAGIGGLVFRQGALDGLPGDLRSLLTTTGGKAGQMLSKRIRNEDQKAWDYLSSPGRLEVTNLSAAEKAQWDTKLAEVRERLGQGIFAPELVVELECRAGKRSGPECSAFSN